jgi:hypothetical protein
MFRNTFRLFMVTDLVFYFLIHRVYSASNLVYCLESRRKKNLIVTNIFNINVCLPVA